MDTVTLPYKLQIFVPQALRHKLKDLAHRRGTSLQQLVNDLLNAEITKDEAVPPPHATPRVPRSSPDGGGQPQRREPVSA